jgi:hypothetical protein
MSFAGMPAKIFLAALLLLGAARMMAVSSRFQDVTNARIENGYAIVLHADGSKRVVPLASIDSVDREWLTELSRRSPLAQGKSKVTVVNEATLVTAKKTIQIAKVEGPIETVQLCPPNVMRDQIGGTCMLYARVHWLDIAGYYVDVPAINRVINNTPPDHPWSAPHYVQGLTSIIRDHKPRPVLHALPPQEDAFEWTRQELRKGRPVLGAFPREIWQALPPGFVAAHPWNGGSVGHQIVINGFTWNQATRQGTFHIINSWAELPQFDLATESAKDGALVIEQSLSPFGEFKPKADKEVVQAITFVKAVGKTNLYEVQTNLGTRRVLALNEAAAREMIENAP